MSNLVKSCLALMAGTAAIAAGASAVAENDGALDLKGDAVRSICFTGGIDRFSPASDSAVIVRARHKQYLVETRGCLDLDRTKSLGLASTGMCLSKGDYLIASESMFGGDGQRCMVTGTYEWGKSEDS